MRQWWVSEAPVGTQQKEDHLAPAGTLRLHQVPRFHVPSDIARVGFGYSACPLTVLIDDHGLCQQTDFMTNLTSIDRRAFLRLTLWPAPAWQ